MENDDGGALHRAMLCTPAPSLTIHKFLDLLGLFPPFLGAVAHSWTYINIYTAKIILAAGPVYGIGLPGGWVPANPIEQLRLS